MGTRVKKFDPKKEQRKTGDDLKELDKHRK
jgi:hypothetical protein